MSEAEPSPETRNSPRKNPTDAPESLDRTRPGDDEASDRPRAKPLETEAAGAGNTAQPEAFGRTYPAAGIEAFGRAHEPSAPEAFGVARKEPTRKDDPQENLKRERSDPRDRPDKGPKDAPLRDRPNDLKSEEHKEQDSGDEKRKNGQQKNRDQKDEPQKPPIYKRPLFWIILGIALLIIIVAGVLYWLHKRQYEKTDDAYIDGNVTQIAPQVSAPILRMYVDDNMLVKPGQLLIELDPTDFQVALDQAKAAEAAARGRLAQAKAQVDAAHATVQQRQAEIDAAQVELNNATRNLQRYQNVDPRARSQQQLDNALTAQKNAQASLDQAKAQKVSADANVATAEANVKAADGDLQRTIADEHRAEVNLGYCKIRAPVKGRVTSRNVNVGSYVQTGQAMFSLVSPDVWVVANFKETQLAHMKPGQPVTISVDAYPDKKWNGHVQSIQAGSGSRFSILPAENATGNFVKIVQRVPVKITFDHGPNDSDYRLLSPGLSVVPRVKVR